MSKKAILLTILLLNLPNTVVADIYKWKDENGSIHFSDSPNTVPENSEKITENKKPTRITGGYFEERIYRTPQPVQQFKLPDPPKYWKDPQTEISYILPINEPQVLKDRQRIKQQQTQLETAQATAGAIILLIIIAIGTYIILSIISFFDILKSKFEGNDKMIWVLVILFVPIIGEIAYLTIGRKQKIKETYESDRFYKPHTSDHSREKIKFCNAFRCNGIMNVKTERDNKKYWVCDDCGNSVPYTTTA